MRSSTHQVELLFQQQQQSSSNPKANYSSLAEEVCCGAGQGAIRAELMGAYGEKLLGSSSAYLQAKIMGRYLSNPQYYFQVNDDYVKNKLKLILFPFLYKGNWFRACERNVGYGEFCYKPPIYDVNAPDLYIPFMAFGTYLVLSGFILGINDKFSPEAMGLQFWNGTLCWILETLLLKATLQALGDGDVPLLDIVAYGGYVFVTVSVAMATRIVWRSSFFAVGLWECFCTGVLLVKIMKRVLIAEMRSCDKHSSTKRHYLLLLVAIAQVPLLFWLSSTAGF